MQHNSGAISNFAVVLPLCVLFTSSLWLFSNPADAAQYLKSIMNISEQAAGLTRQLPIYADEEPQKLESIDLNELVTDVLIIASASVSKRVTLKPILRKELPAIDGDIGQVQQVVMNLIINAAEPYANQSGIVEIRTLLRTSGHAVHMLF